MRKNPARLHYFTFSLLSNKRLHFPSNNWICICMLTKFCHLMVTLGMFKWYERLHFKEHSTIYWINLVNLRWFYLCSRVLMHNIKMISIYWIDSCISSLTYP